MDKLTERKKMLVAMEFVARQINDETVLEGWLMNGVPDGDIEYGNFDISQIDDEDYMVGDEGFKEIMSCFLRRMMRAYKSGALYCGGVVCKEKSDYEQKEKYTHQNQSDGESNKELRCKYGYSDCVLEPAYIKENYPEWWESLGCPTSCPDCKNGDMYDDEDK